MKEATVKVEGMSCRSCIARIEGAIGEIGAQGHVNFEQGTVHVRFDDSKLQLSQIQEAIESKGYNARI
ncbi:cation transporter [Paenibacillus sp. P26]|nr:cation transporter [Paenibacillus sp. P26]UUZ91877.1 cation transporter [Paenibacillus sp. P25]